MRDRNLWVWPVAVLLIGLSLYIWAARYHECRAMGFSRFYCLTAR